MASMSATIPPPFCTETATGAPPAAPAPVRGRRSRRLCIDAHTEFVGTLVAELQSSVTRLQTASRRLVDGNETDGVDRETRDIARLVGLLDAIDGPPSRRRLEPVSLPRTLLAGDHKVTFEGTMDAADPRRSWQLRSGRRVADGEGIHVRLMEAGRRYRVELSIAR